MRGNISIYSQHQNHLSGTALEYGRNKDGTVDSNLDGIIALSSALPSSKIKKLIISNCGLGPKSIAIVASTLAAAGVEALDLSNNPFDPGDLEAPANVKINVDGCAIPESEDDY